MTREKPWAGGRGRWRGTRFWTRDKNCYAELIEGMRALEFAANIPPNYAVGDRRFTLLQESFDEFADAREALRLNPEGAGLALSVMAAVTSLLNVAIIDGAEAQWSVLEMSRTRRRGAAATNAARSAAARQKARRVMMLAATLPRSSELQTAKVIAERLNMSVHTARAILRKSR